MKKHRSQERQHFKSMQDKFYFALVLHLCSHENALIFSQLEVLNFFLCILLSEKYLYFVFSYGPEDQDELSSSDNKPRILLLGLRRCANNNIVIVSRAKC